MILIQFCFGKLLLCSKIKQSVCAKNKNYNSESNPEPFPTKINIGLKFNEVIGINEEQQTITLSIKAGFAWHDYRLDVNRSKDDIKRYVDEYPLGI